MSVLTQKETPSPTLKEDFLPINGTDYVELYVSNSKQAAHYYKTAFGYQDYAYKGLETGEKNTEPTYLPRIKSGWYSHLHCIVIQKSEDILTNTEMVSKS